MTRGSGLLGVARTILDACNTHTTCTATNTMRCHLLVMLVFVSACGESYELSVIPPPSSSPLIVGMTYTYGVYEQMCDPPPDGSCDPMPPESLTVKTASTVVMVSDVEPGGAWPANISNGDGAGTFNLIALAPGTAQIAVTADGGSSTSLTVDVIAAEARD
jgi:hypothetical protein